MLIKKLIILFVTLNMSLCLSNQSTQTDKTFVIIVPSYNNKEWYQKNLDSIFNQTYKKYRVIYIDDCSTDDTGNLVKNYVMQAGMHDKLQFIQNQKRKLALENLYDAIHSCSKDEIIVTVDGDDWLANDNVLSHLNDVYKDENVWLTYGQFIEFDSNLNEEFLNDKNYITNCEQFLIQENNYQGSKQLPFHIIDQNKFREYKWVTSHLRTFYAGLFQKIKREDLLFEDKFYPMAWDIAFMYPMLEMAGQHSKFISKILYVYNTRTPLNDRKVNKELQCKLFSEIKNKKNYEPLENLLDSKSSCLKKFVILVPSFNNSEWYKKNLNSIINQNYEKYRIIYIDDCSTDGTGNLVEEYIKENKVNNIKLIKNTKRQLALANIYKGVLMTNDDEIIVLVDGDDQLADNEVLSKLNNIYQQEDIWITYGNFKYLSSNCPCDYNPSFPEHIIKNNMFREHPHGLTHLRTFYSWLFKQIKIEDLFYEGSFYKMTYDVAIFTPLIEMASERHKYIQDIFYTYNDLNSINDHKISKNLQHRLNKLIRQKNKYNRLDSSKENLINTLDLKTDLLVFANYNNAKETCHMIKKVNNINKTFLIYETFSQEEEKLFEDLKVDFNYLFIDLNKLSKAFLNQLFTNIFQNGSEYITFIEGNINLTKQIDLENFIKSLECTKAFASYISLNNNLFIVQNTKNNCIEILKNTYTFLYEKAKTLDAINFAIYRKKDININQLNDFEKLEMQWKYIGWQKVCLFNFVD